MTFTFRAGRPTSSGTIHRSSASSYRILPLIWLSITALWTLAASPVRAAPHLEPVWRKSFPSLHSFRISPGGDAAVVTYKDGRVHSFSRRGTLQWGVTLPSPQRVSLSTAGDSALIYPPQQAFSTVATLIRGGKTCRQLKLDGAIVAGGLSPDGRFGGAVTRKGWLYLFRLRGSCFSSTRIRVRSSPRTLLAARSGLLLVGYSGPGGVEAYGSDGRLRWRLPGEVKRVYDLTSGPKGHTIGILSYRVGHGDRIRAYVLASSGSRIWQADVPGIYPRMSLESDGIRAAVGYTEVLRAGERTGYARKIAYYNSRGRLFWEKGGLFFSPQLLGVVTPGPTVIARGEASDLYLLDEQGRMQDQYRHPTMIRRAEISRNGRAILVWDVRNTMTFLRWAS